MEAAPGLERAELGAIRGDADVGRHGELEAARQRPAVDGSDHRLGEAMVAARQPAEAELGPVGQHLRGRADVFGDVVLEVHAGAEGIARAGDDHHVDAVVVRQFLPGLAQRQMHLLVDGVLGLGTVQAQGGNAFADFTLDDGHDPPGFLRHNDVIFL